MLVIALDYDAATLRSARSVVQAHMNDAPGDAAATAVLLTSELVTNAFLHAVSGPRRLEVKRDLRSLHVGVSDGDACELPLRGQPASPLASYGRGLMLVDGLADTWGVSGRTLGGKTVWFHLRWWHCLVRSDHAELCRVDRCHAHGP